MTTIAIDLPIVLAFFIGFASGWFFRSQTGTARWKRDPNKKFVKRSIEMSDSVCSTPGCTKHTAINWRNNQPFEKCYNCAPKSK